MEVKKEMTGWRDLSLSQRHRKWGYDAPMVDCDFIACNYNAGRPTLLVEYKRVGATINLEGTSFAALRRLASNERDPVPFLCVRYEPNFSTFTAIPQSAPAAALIGSSKQRVLSEREWVEVIYRSSGRALPAGLSFNWKGELVA